MRSFRDAAILLSLTLTVFNIHCQIYKPIKDSFRICLAAYYQPVHSEFLIGKWYYVYHFTAFWNLPPSAECREVLFERPSEQQLLDYRRTYNETGVPYTFDEDLVLYRETWSDVVSGLMIGGKEAKFFLQKPRAADRPADYSVIALRVVNNDFVVHQACLLAGSSKWLLSRKKHPSDEELRDIVNSRSDLKNMKRQKFCHAK